MTNYLIVTDNMSDLPESYCRERGLHQMYLSYVLDGVEYNGEHQLEPSTFYEKMRAGSMPVTSQISIEKAKECLLEYSRECPNIICIAFSSGLSGTYNSISVAAQQLMEEQEGLHITVIDSLAASLGQGLLVHKALEKQKAGLSYDELVTWVEENKNHVVHNFTVDDLFHLHRGGRVSKATAIIGSMVQIKPMLHVDEEGHLIAVGKVRGRRKSIHALADAMEKQMGSRQAENDVVFISHGDCREDANTLKDMIQKRFGIDAFLIDYVGPTIGAHSGPGTLALFYMGDVK